MGIGNLILRDDGVGIRIAQKLKEEDPALEVIETSEVGIALLDLVVGYRKLIIIDSVKTGKGQPGELYMLKLKNMKPGIDLPSSHGIDIATAFELGHRLGYPMPGQIRIYAVEVKNNETFGEGLSPEIEKRIPAIAREIASREKLTKTPQSKRAGVGSGI